jgi:hypothetical protein
MSFFVFGVFVLGMACGVACVAAVACLLHERPPATITRDARDEPYQRLRCTWRTATWSAPQAISRATVAYLGTETRVFEARRCDEPAHEPERHRPRRAWPVLR